MSEEMLEYRGKPATLHIGCNVLSLNPGDVVSIPAVIATDLKKNKNVWRKPTKKALGASGLLPEEGE